MIRKLFYAALLAAASAAGAPAMAQSPLVGVTEYVHIVDLHARVAGVVKEVLVKEGDNVTEDQALIQLDDSVQRSRLDIASAVAAAEGQRAKARADVALAGSRLERIKRAAARGGARQWEVREAQHALSIARSELRTANETAKGNAARKTLEETILTEHAIRAPFAGTVLEVDAERGGLARGEQPLVVIADRSKMRLVIFLPVDMVGEVEAAAASGALSAELGAPVNAETPLELEAIDPRIEPSSGTMRTVFQFDNATLKTPSGVEAVLLLPDGNDG